MARLRDAAPMGVARQYTYINRSKMEEEIVRFTKVATPLGDMRAYCSPKGICCLEFTSSAERLEQFHQRLQRYYGNPKVLPGECDAHASLQQWLCRYFDGDSSASQTPMDMRGTVHELAVWRELQKIHPGHTISYGELARRCGQPTATRAVATAVRRNPLSIIIPCHRVIGAHGELTGYGGGLRRKRWLLEHEKKWNQYFSAPKPNLL